jgi:hypothetical protein
VIAEPSDARADPGDGSDDAADRGLVARAVGQAAEVVVYAPIGFVVQAPELLPTLARRGRHEVDAVRTLGGEVLDRGHRWLTRRLRQAAGEGRSALRGLALHDAAPGGVRRDEPTSGPVASVTDIATGTTMTSDDTEPIRRAGSDRDGTSTLDSPPSAASADVPAPPVESLAIPGYDSLSASQVVPRLASLETHEREAIRSYEQAHRGRKTILNRIAQLQGS